jgi:hypothetical protein
MADTTTTEQKGVFATAWGWIMNNQLMVTISLPFIVPVIVKLFGITDYPYVFIFSWTAFFWWTPIFWARYGSGKVANFWKHIAANCGLTLLCVFLFLVLRGCLSHVVHGSLLNSLAVFQKQSLTGNIFGYTPGRVLFEATFTLIFGTIILEAIYKKSWKALTTLGIIVVIVFIVLAYFYGFGEKVAETASGPMSEVNVDKAVQKFGALGGPSVQLFRAAFGPSREQLIKPETHTFAKEGEEWITQEDYQTGDRLTITVSPGRAWYSPSREIIAGPYTKTMKADGHIKFVAYQDNTTVRVALEPR